MQRVSSHFELWQSKSGVSAEMMHGETEPKKTGKDRGEKYSLLIIKLWGFTVEKLRGPEKKVDENG